MIDKDKVIKGLECCNAGTMCDECDYHISQFCLHELKADALTLIREQQEEIQRLYEALNPNHRRRKTKYVGRSVSSIQTLRRQGL